MFSFLGILILNNLVSLVFYIKKNNIKLPAIKMLVKIGVEEMLG